jgi:hypothetical protein
VFAPFPVPAIGSDSLAMRADFRQQPARCRRRHDTRRDGSDVGVDVLDRGPQLCLRRFVGCHAHQHGGASDRNRTRENLGQLRRWNLGMRVTD